MAQDISKEDLYERPNKYGSWDVDLSELADCLAGRDPVRRDRAVRPVELQESDAVDETFLREAGHPRNHYGE